MRDAKPGEIYQDQCGKRWLVTHCYTEPTVGLQEIRPLLRDEDRPGQMFGGVSGLMWNGFVKLHDAPPADPPD